MKRINIIAWDNGFGLTRHIRLLTDALREAGYEVSFTPVRRGKLRKWFGPWRWRCFGRWLRLIGRDPRERFDANLMIEHIRPEYLGFARINLFAPHPEWCLPKDVALLGGIDGVLCMTRHAEPIFQDLGCVTHYIGFTSENRLDPALPRERKFFHLAGRSANKGTERLLRAWRAHPQWPTLTVVQSARTAKPGPAAPNIVHRLDYLDDTELRGLQNSHAFHVCTSEAEGYGHYLVEAMGVGAVVLATDAPPMNEMITSERGLTVAYESTGRQQLATTYFVSEAGIVAAVERALALTDEELRTLGNAAREWFADNDRQFPARVAAALERAFAAKATASAARA